jgi:hypothetical protein
MNSILSAAPKGVEELRYQGLVRFAELLENQTRTRLASDNISGLVHTVNAEIQDALQGSISQLQNQGGNEQAITRLQSANARLSRLNDTVTAGK